jgi:hypothetical protein
MKYRASLGCFWVAERVLPLPPHFRGVSIAVPVSASSVTSLRRMPAAIPLKSGGSLRCLRSVIPPIHHQIHEDANDTIDIPEPSSLGLLGGFLALGASRRNVD